MKKFASAAVLGVFMVLLMGAAPPDNDPDLYTQHNLVSDGAVPADLVDADLVNAWGLVAGPTTPWWVANNGTSVATLYNGNTGAKLSLRVSVPSDPTGTVFNGGTGFVVTSTTAPMTQGPARFLFATEDGTILGWNPNVDATTALVVKDRSPQGAVYKGLAIATTASGEFLYATDFHNGTVDVFDSNFTMVPGGFVDTKIPSGYAPFGIRAFDNVILVTYALQDAAKHDDVAGQGHGFIDMFDTAGKLLRRVASRGQLNSPWGLALAPSNFGRFSGDLLVGNFGDGRIHAFDWRKTSGNGEFHRRGALRGADNKRIVIDGLWSLSFGNDAAAGPSNALFFTAGPFGEMHGLFGRIDALPDEPEN